MTKNINLKLAFLLILFTCNIQKTYSQVNKNIRIHIDAVTSIASKEFLIDINQTGSNTKIVYHLLDSVRHTALEQDTLNTRLMQIFMQKQTRKDKPKQDSLVAQLMQIRRRYSVFRADSIVLTDQTDTAYTAYTTILQQVASAGKDQLENTKANKSRISIDGTSIDFEIMAGGNITSAYAHSPSPQSYPLLYNLLEKSLTIYRDKKHNQFLNKAQTSGY